MASIEQTLRQMSNETTAKTFAFNAQEAQRSRDYQTQMSNTSHQREVDDLKRAGLNPVLSSNGGAQSYSASSASAQADNSAVGVLASIYQTKMNNDNARKIAQMQNKNNLEMARINAAASMYGSETAASASRYSTDHTKYGMVDSFINGLLGTGNGGKSSSRSTSSARKAGSTLKKGLEGRQKYTLTGRIISAINKRRNK